MVGIGYLLRDSLAKRGARVGILDADIYGPSLPTMISPVDCTIRPSRKVKHFVEPVEYEGVKCMSFGFVNQRAAPGAGGRISVAILRLLQLDLSTFDGYCCRVCALVKQASELL